MYLPLPRYMYVDIQPRLVPAELRSRLGTEKLHYQQP